MRIKKEFIFRLVSILFLLSLTIFFSSRLIYNYMLENGEKKEVTNLLSDKIISNISKQNISYEKGKYTLKGKLENNYISYSGLLWRILEVENNNIKIVTEDSITLLPWGENKKYKDSNIYRWITSEQGIKNNLTNVDLHLEKINYCINNTDEINITDCEKENSYVSILSMNDYINAGANESFLNNSTYFWLSATTNENKAWYVFDNGGIKYDDNKNIYGVRTVITLKNIEYVYGEGTKENPYIVSNEPVNILKDVELGNYIEYSDYSWKVVSKDNEKIKVVLESPLKINSQEIEKMYSKTTDTFNLNDKTNIAYYLNNNFYNSLKDKNYLKKGDFYIGKYNNYDYEELYNEKVNAYVGLLTIGDIYLTENDNMYLLSSITNNNTIPIINENNTLFYNFTTHESKIKPVIYLDSSLEIKCGIGDINYPFELR